MNAPDIVTLTLTRRQALALSALSRWVSGLPGGPRDAFNGTSGSILEQLRDQDDEDHRAATDATGAYFAAVGEIEARPEWPAEGGAA